MSQAIGKACHCEEYPKGTCFAARSDAAIRSFPARRRIPTPVTRSLARNDRKRDVEDAVPYGVQQSYGDVGTLSPTTVHRTRPQGTMPTSPRRTNAHFAAGHMGSALQGTPVMQDGTSGRRPLQRLTAPIRRRRCPHRPADSKKRQAQAPASLPKKSIRTFSTSWQAKSQNKNYILFCDFGRCGG